MWLLGPCKVCQTLEGVLEGRAQEQIAWDEFREVFYSLLLHYCPSEEEDGVSILATGGEYVHGGVLGEIPHAREVCHG